MKPKEQHELNRELFRDDRYKQKVINNKKKDMLKKRKWKDERVLDEEGIL